MKRVCNVNNGKTSGSALVIVLGILSVLMLMSVAFSTFMRTERGATTNLKNAHVAEQALHSALAAAIQAIDDSLAETQDGHSNAVVDSPVAVWPQPWLASCAPDDRGSEREKNDSKREYNRRNDGYFQSRLREGSDPAPSVLCSGAAEYMTSNQIAMVRSAAVDWAPLYSGIGASSIAKDSAATMGVNAGYPQNSESIVGRYAFVALDTTGYLDLGKIGDLSNLNNALDARKESSGDDPWRFIPVDGGVKAKTPGGTEIPSPLVSSGRSKLASLLNDAKALFSLSDAKAKKDAGGFNWTKPAQAKKKNLHFMPPDLYAGTGVSLAPLNPEGEPKIALPYGEDGANLSVDELNDLANRIYPAMVSVFARSRREGGVTEWWNENTQSRNRESLHLFGGAGGLLDLYVPRAALATVGILDAVDGDAVPGKKSGKGDADSYWAMLAGMGDNIEVKVWDDRRTDDSGDVLRTVKSGISGASVENPLDYPCTVGAPLMKTFYAYVTIDLEHPHYEYKEDRNPNHMWFGAGVSSNYNWQVEYDAVLHVGAIAADDNRDDTAGARRMDAELEVTFDVMAQTPASYGTVSGGSTASGDVKDTEVEYHESASYAPEIKWDGFWLENQKLSAKATIDESVDSSANRLVNVSDSFPFKIICGVKTKNLVGKPTEDDYFPLTHHEYTLDSATGTSGSLSGGGAATTTDKPDVWVPIRFKAEIKVDGKTVQQVPAPRLESDNTKSWWVRVDAGVYHDAEKSVVKDTAKVDADHNKVDGSRGDLAQGWAECLAPQFGMDTTSLATANAEGEPTWEANHKFWINNVCARAGYVPNGLGQSAKMIFAELQKELDPSDSIEYSNNGEITLDRLGLFTDGGSIRPSVSQWLFRDSAAEWEELDNGLWYDWFNEYDDATCADLMHQLSKSRNDLGDRDWIVDGKFGNGDGGRTQARLNNEIYTHFRTGGITSVGDLGSILVGPYETLSLFKMWRSPPYDPLDSGAPDSDFHPVFDYFTMDEDRYPASKDLSDVELSADGTVDWNSLGTRSSAPKQRHLFSAVQNGRVNLNLPRLLEYYEDVDDKGNKAVRVRRADEFNPYPLAAALYGAPYPGLKNDRPVKQSVSEQAAVDIASAYANMLRNVDRHPTESEYKAATMVNHVTNLVELARASKKGSVSVIRAPAVRDVSFFASAGGTSSNAVLKAFLDGLKDTASGEVNQRQNLCDNMREGFLRGVSDAFTTRGQSFLLVLRADAYTARFGRQEDPTDGTSLASSHALVELFRDPEPARLPDGTFPRDADGNPVLYHNWFIRSFRLF